ncbi:MAG: hypothetical protein ACLVJX_00680 [Merdibacter sp.]
MKIAIEKSFPTYFRAAYPEEFSLFSHLETTSAIPQVLFAITHGRRTDSPMCAFIPGAVSTGIARPFMQ